MRCTARMMRSEAKTSAANPCGLSSPVFPIFLSFCLETFSVLLQRKLFLSFCLTVLPFFNRYTKCSGGPPVGGPDRTLRKSTIYSFTVLSCTGHNDMRAALGLSCNAQSQFECTVVVLACTYLLRHAYHLPRWSGWQRLPAA